MAIEKVIRLKTDFDDKGLKQLDQGLESVNQNLEQAEQSSKDLSQQNQKTSKSFKGVATSVKGIGVALKAAGIGLVIALFAKLADVVSQNQKVLDFLSTAGNAVNMVFQDLFSIFDGGLPSITDIGTAIKNNLIERFKSLIEFSGLLGKTLTQLFKGEFAEALETAKEAGKELLDVATGVDNSAEKLSEYASEVIETADAFTQLTNQAKLAEAQLRRVFEQSDRDAEIQRRIRDDFNLTFQQRIKASEELARVLDEQEKTQLRLAGIEVQRAQNAIKFSGDNVENQVALINALAEQDAIEADIAGRRAEQEAQDRALRQEIIDARNEELVQTQIRGESELQLKREFLDAEILAVTDARIKEAEINKQYEEDELIRRKILAQQQVALAGQTLNNISNVLGRSSKAGKAVAVAQALINTYQGISAELATKTATPFDFALKIANIASVTAIGFKSVKDILATKLPNLGGGGVSTSSGGATQSAPAFNVVGNSGISQIAQTLNQEQEPVQAYVVASNVTSAQEVNRDIVDNASLG